MNVILLPCTVLCLVFLWLWKAYTRNKTDFPPLAEGALPILGHTWIGFINKERLYEAIMKTVLGSSLEKNEEAVYLNFGIWKLYFCMNPEDGSLLGNSCLKKDPLYGFFSSLAGGEHGLLSSDAPSWKIHRKLLNPTMNQSVLNSYLVPFNEQSSKLVGSLSQELGKGYFNPLPYLKETVLHNICATLIRVSVIDEGPLIKEFDKAAEIFKSCFVERMRKIYYFNETLFNWSNLKKKQEAAATIVHNFTSIIIRKKKAKMSDQEDEETDKSTLRFKSFLNLLLEMGKNGALSESEIQQEANTFIGAAYDSTYHALGMMLLIIGSYPEVQRKIFDELQAVFEGSSRDVEKQDMSKLKYLEAVMKETLRLYPVIVAFGRVLDKELKLQRYTLPAGSRCFMSIYHAGRHPVWGADVEQFRPERWLDGSLPHGVGAYAVFGLGRRSCIGSNFAMMLMKTVLCHVVRQYRISGDVSRLVLNIDVVVSPVSGHHISLERRTENGRVDSTQ